MNSKGYSEATYKAIQNGIELSVALKRLVSILDARGHAGLYPRILRELQTRFAQEEITATAKVRLAKSADEKKYKTEIEAFMKECDISLKDVVLDETLVGGYVLEGKGRRVDASYKKSLLTIYKNLIA